MEIKYEHTPSKHTDEQSLCQYAISNIEPFIMVNNKAIKIGTNDQNQNETNEKKARTSKTCSSNGEKI